MQVSYKNQNFISIIDQNLHILETLDKEEFLYIYGPVNLPVEVDGEIVTFQWYTWFKHRQKYTTKEIVELLPLLAQSELQQSSFLVLGDIKKSDVAKVRIHSICHTGDVFGSLRCDCGTQLYNSLRKLKRQRVGVVFYLSNHEGRGIGLFSKSMAYSLQENGFDTVDANLALGYPDDLRSYEDVIVILKSLRDKPIVLLTNNPKKVEYLEKHKIIVSKTETIEGNVNKHNYKYMKTKIEKMNHTLNI